MAYSPLDWQALTTVELKDHISDSAIAVLPVAAIEQHGPHLPLATDRIIGEGILQAAVERFDDARLLVLPTLPIGLSLEHSGFPGTLSLRPDTAIDVLVDIGQSIASAGIHRLVIFNSHGGNRQIIDLAALQLRQRFRMLVVKANYFRYQIPQELVDAEELSRGLHGGELETAMMLHLAPDQVRQDLIEHFQSLEETVMADNRHLKPEGEAAFAWMGQDLNPAGVVGRASRATAGQGAQLVAHFAGALAETFRETARFNLRLLR
ncbi:creatininase family protein [Marinobacter halodurans]|uniref:Creatininase family protein n=1 Tax=Marinobacter halodurans TaxID=2528979 RepID=A0ABY1ZKK7_9GAMM|nr:creatininase family protein [Marinobacter halodurans]TBW51554.1 creatininase family protein [Marinobacter halodurans]